VQATPSEPSEAERFALRELTDDVGPRLLDYLFAPRDLEKARTLHTDLRELLELARGADTW
jgi:hypothetical protein